MPVLMVLWIKKSREMSKLTTICATIHPPKIILYLLLSTNLPNHSKNPKILAKLVKPLQQKPNANLHSHFSDNKIQSYWTSLTTFHHLNSTKYQKKNVVRRANQWKCNVRKGFNEERKKCQRWSLPIFSAQNKRIINFNKKLNEILSICSNRAAWFTRANRS